MVSKTHVKKVRIITLPLHHYIVKINTTGWQKRRQFVEIAVRI